MSFFYKNKPLAISFLLILFFEVLMFYFLDNPDNFMLALVTGYGTFVATLIGVYLSLHFTKVQEEAKTNREARKRERFYLGLLWNELRFNKHRVEEIKRNYNFKVDDPNLMKWTLIRFTNVYETIKLFKTTAYEALLSSGSVICISSDDVYNSIETAYADLKHFQSSAEGIFINIKENTTSIQVINEVSIRQELMLKIQDDIKFLARELAIAFRTTLKAIEVIDNHLLNQSVKLEVETLRNSVLEKNDQKFISNSIKYPSQEEFKIR